jgi:nitrite reductase/ring-hydroxylating ferredoxin subunit
MIAKKPHPSAFVRVASVRDVAAGGGLAVTVNGAAVVIFKVRGRFVALDAACPHQGVLLSAGTVDGSDVICAAHCWQFHIPSGTLVVSGEPALRRYPLRVRNGEILVSPAGAFRPRRAPRR